MKQEQDKRRSFLKHILAGSVVVVGAAGAVKTAKAGAKTTIEPAAEDILYRETEHFAKYYKSLKS